MRASAAGREIIVSEISPVDVAVLSHRNKSQIEIDANARLIAAAPELLEALKGLMMRAARDAEYYAPNGNEPIWAFIEDASDAIAKATGEEI